MEIKNNFTRYIPLLLVLIVIGAVIVLIDSRKADVGAENGGTNNITVLQNENTERKTALYEPAKEISSPDAFINTDEITVSEFIGKKIVLVDFWTYSCINCQRTLPYLNSWHEKYADDGLVILGIHTPEFEFEKELANVQKAVDQFNVEYPVILDNDFSTWKSYNNRYWPRKYLIDVDGFIVYDHIGEGGYEETEEKIVELLNEKNKKLGLAEIAMEGEAPDAPSVDFSQIGTPEIYFGSNRLELLTNAPDASCAFGACIYDAENDTPRNSYALEGEWETLPEKIILKSDTGKILLRFYASNVNIVAGAPDGATLTTTLDGGITKNIVPISNETLYNLFDADGVYGEHLLEIEIEGAGAEFYTFTFG